MPNTTVIEEYLAAIGFKVDDQSYRQFKNVLDTTTKQFKGLGETSIIAATAISAAVVKTASDMSKLYYSAQMSGGSVGKLQEFRFAAEQIGLSADQAGSAVQSLADTLRTPGKATLLETLGVNSKEDPTEMIVDLADRLKTMAPYMQDLYSQTFGVDPHTMRQIINNEDELKKSRGEMDAFFRRLGYDPKQASEQYLEFSRNVNKLETEFGFLAVIGLNKLVPFLDHVLSAGEGVLKFFADASKATDGWSSALVALVTTLGGISVAKGTLGFLGRLLGIGGVAAEGAEAGAEAGSIAGPAGIAAGAAIGIGGAVAYQHRQAIEDWWTKTFPSGGWNGGSAVAGHNPGNMRAWNRGHEDYFTKGKSGQFVAFGSDAEGLSALAGQLLKYAKGGLDSVSAIINKYAPAGDHNDTGAYIRDVTKRLGVGADSHLNLNDPDTLDKLMAAIVQHEQGFQPYSADMIDQAARYRLGKGSGNAPVTITQTNDTHFHGVSDPQAAGRAAVSQQARLNGDLVRNFSGAVQ